MTKPNDDEENQIDGCSGYHGVPEKPILQRLLARNNLIVGILAPKIAMPQPSGSASRIRDAIGLKLVSRIFGNVHGFDCRGVDGVTIMTRHKRMIVMTSRPPCQLLASSALPWIHQRASRR